MVSLKIEIVEGNDKNVEFSIETKDNKPTNIEKFLSTLVNNYLRFFVANQEGMFKLIRQKSDEQLSETKEVKE